MNSRWLLVLVALLTAGALAACDSTETATPGLSPELASVQGTWVSECKIVPNSNVDSWVDTVTIAGSTLTATSTDYSGVSDCTGLGVTAAPDAFTVTIGAAMTPSNDPGPANKMDLTASDGTMKMIVKIDTSTTPKTFRVGDDQGPVDGEGRFTDLETRVFTQMTGTLLNLQGSWVASCMNEAVSPGSWINTFHVLGFVLTVETLQFSADDCPAGTGVVQPLSAGDQGLVTIGPTILPTNDSTLADKFDYLPNGSSTPMLSIVQVNTGVSPHTFRMGNDAGATDGDGRFTELETRVFTKQ